MGWTSCPPKAWGGRDAHPTRLDNLFVGSPKSGELVLEASGLRMMYITISLTSDRSIHS
ncbi:MAG: hypothetical protein V7L01_27640 [Nostoc sp.]|uniref:hypothetical protein n=1 Tax=Nostoc sp. TaxID=1180 RepID=UPI002FF56C67